MTDTTGGVKLTTTYAAYISKTQPADTYSGQVIYTLVHPASHAAPGTGIEVTYNSGELQFAGGETSNSVIYVENCPNFYIATTPLIAKTSNVVDDKGTQEGSYPTGETLIPIVASGASKMKVVLRYGFSEGTSMAIIKGDWEEDSEPSEYKTLEGPSTGTETYVFDGDAVTLFMWAENAPSTTDGQDYGYFAEVYPIYNTEPAGIETETSAICSYTADSGAYMEPNHFKGTWTIGNVTFTDEEEIKAYIGEHAEEIASAGLAITASNPYAIVYDGNTSTAGTMNGFVTIPDPTSPNDIGGVNNTVDLMAPNFKKTGYGFAGWSENPNAVVNGNDIIYGPNQSIYAGDLTYDEDDNKTAVLYAVWVEPSDSMQNFSCEILDYDEVDALIDMRDHNVYTVSKLADGNCWMMENLRLDNTATINSTNTDRPANTFISIAASTDDWCTDSNETCINQNRLNTNNTNLGGTNASNTPLVNAPGHYNGSNAAGGIKGSGGSYYSWYSYGNYYNWYTAIAGTDTHYGPESTNGNATGSICPSGWELPIGHQSYSGKSQFSDLDSAMGGTGRYQSSDMASNRWRSYPANFVYSGGWWGFAADARGSFGGYWSGTDDSNNNVMILDFSFSHVNPDHQQQISNEKWCGFAVRCLSAGK